MAGGWQSVPRVARAVVVLVLGCGLSMGIGFVVVNRMAAGLWVPPVQEESRIEEGRALRLHANMLVVLMSDFLNAQRGDPERLMAWIDEVFRPGIARAQRGIRAQRHEGWAQAELLAAANGLAGLADHPADPERRDEVVRRVLAAASSAEERIGELGVAAYQDEPAQLLQFRLYGQ